MYSQKKLILLTINNSLLKDFKKTLNIKNTELYFMLRRGVSKELLNSIFERINYYEYDYENYESEKLSNVTNLKFDELWLLCRDVKTVNFNYFLNVFWFALFQSNKIILCDIFGNKKILLKKDIIFNYIKHLFKNIKKINHTISQVLFFIWSYLLFISLEIILIVLSPFIRLKQLIKKTFNLKMNICIAKRVHSNQSFFIAKGLKERGVNVLSINVFRHPFGYDKCDIDISLLNSNRYSIFFTLCVLYVIVGLYSDVILFENNGESVFVSPLSYNWSINSTFQKIELYTYYILGLKSVFEMRDCTVYDREQSLNHTYRNRCKHCNSNAEKKLCRNEYYVNANKIAIRLADKILYSTPDLAPFLPNEATWLPNAIIIDNNEKYTHKNSVIKIIHSNTNPLLKGTDLVNETIKQLQMKYAIDFNILKGTKHEDVLKKIRESDIVLGQFNAGSYGNFEIECMKMGKPIIGYINEEFLKIYMEPPPILSINSNDAEKSLYEITEKLILNETLRNDLGDKGRKYVLKYHDYKLVSEKLLKILKEVYQ